jgi:uroporphyrinogen III methyltransferase/synthase
VDSFAEHHPQRGPLVIEALIDAARQGLRVVRLKGGDPFVFGRGAEEAEALGQAGIPFEIVPGVTAALGAGAYAGIPLTDRRHASAVAFVAGHQQSQGDLDWSALARFPGTLIFYMAMSRLADIVGQLLQAGISPDTPAAVIHQATTADQRTVMAPLAELPATLTGAEVGAPSLVFVGPVVRLRAKLSWYEARPLFGRHILVTRPRGQAAEMVRELEALGAAVWLQPAVEICEPADWTAADQAITNLAGYDWLIFTSANGVAALIHRLRHLGRDLRALGSVRLAAIGPATAEALRNYYLEPDLVPKVFTSEALAASLRERAFGQRLLLARADRGREVLLEELAGYCRVEQVIVYSQRDRHAFDPEVLARLQQGRIDFVTLTSSNVARAFVAALDGQVLARIRAGLVRLVTISPITTAAVREMGLPVGAEAKEATTAGVTKALVELAAGQGDAASASP